MAKTHRTSQSLMSEYNDMQGSVRTNQFYKLPKSDFLDTMLRIFNE